MSRHVVTGLVLTGVCGFQLVTAFRRGYLYGSYSRLNRSGRPRLFWINVTVYGLLAAFGLLWAARAVLK